MNLTLHSNSVRPQWTSSTSYLLVTVGAVVGVGNILLFPFFIFKYGGLFLLFYLLCEIGIAMPLLYAELMIGRRGKQNPVGAINLLCLENKASFKWSKLGWLYFVIAFLTFGYYIVYAALPAGFVIDGLKAFYVSHASGQIGKLDTHVLGNTYILESCVVVLMLSAMFVVAKGINRGLERISTITVPLYFFILCGLAVYMFFVSSPFDALKNMFAIKPDVSLIVVFFTALSFAFLKFNVGMGSMVLYGSYLPYATSLKRSTLWIVLFDLMISVLAYFISDGLIKSLNPSLFLNDFSNQNVTVIFDNIPHSIMISVLFFSAACLAVWTVLIAMLETMTATLSEQLGISHTKAIALLSIGLLLLATLLVIAQTTLWDEKLLTYSVHASWIKRTALEILTPMAVLLMAIFSSWVIDRETSQSELRFGPIAYGLWRFFMRYVIPVCMVVIFVYGFMA